MSPDAFAQMSFQVAFKKSFGYTPSTYESAATKTFVHGRTETLRTVSDDSARFVDAFLAHENDPENPDKQKTVVESLYKAARTHSLNGKESSEGQGSDRHLLGMMLAAMEMRLPLPAIFEDKSYQVYRTIELSTSAPPPVYGVRVVAFGPVSEKCIGCGYFLRNDKLYFGISCYTDEGVEKFTSNLASTLESLKALFAKHAAASSKL
jgi:carnitine O-acetyltransferase